MILIVILNRGFVAVGRYVQDGDWSTLENAAIIRRWGTTKGLGQIAEAGPTDATILDRTPKQRFPTAQIINTIECDRAKWAEALGL